MKKTECIKCGVACYSLEKMCVDCMLTDPEAVKKRREVLKVAPDSNNSARRTHNTASTSSATAITTVNIVAVIVLMLSMVSGLIMAVIGGQSRIGGGYLVAAGILIAVVGLVQWAFIKVFAGIAEDIKAIREKI